jgi:exo-beta-1,3-glucanase (GH17 family)
MGKAVSLFTFTAAIIVAAWWGLGQAIPMPPSPLDPGEKLYCVSYAPFHGSQTPLDLSTRIEPAQIDRDLAQLARITNCVRTYSVDFGLDRVPEIAQRHGLKVMLGLWISSHTDRTQYQLTTGVAVAKRFPEVVRAIIVGNEALLRGEVSPETLGDYIRSVKSQVAVPVTYADVWEFWLRYRALATVVDFVTIHILPYWEDEPVAARNAAEHVDAIRKRAVESFPGKEVVIGEVGWPSAGRMRHGALPSPAEQVRALSDVLARAKREGFHVNVIEAFDQPWKRTLEGTVGGHWGLFDDATRTQKFSWDGPVSNHPSWRWHAAAGLVLAALVFTAAIVTRRRERDLTTWIAIAGVATVAGLLVGWTMENVVVESLGFGGWLRSLALSTLAVAAPVVGAVALASGKPAPAFAELIGPKHGRVRDPLARALGVLLIALVILALQSALALAFDPRYRDFPFAPLTAAAVPFVIISLAVRRRSASRPTAETVAAVMLAACAVFIAWNETIANWQSLWFCGALLLVAISLVPARAVPS